MIAARRRLAALAGGGPVLAVTLTLVAWNTPSYSGWRDTVSRLGSPGQPWAGVVQSCFIGYGLLVWVGAAPAGQSLRLGRAWTRFVQVFAASAIVAGLAPKDLPGDPHTTASQVHVIATVAGGAAILAALTLTTWRAASGVLRHGSAFTGVLTFVATVAFRLSWDSAYYGAIERAVLIPPMTWLTALAMVALVRSRTEAAPSGA